MKSASRLEIGVHCTLAKTTTRRLADEVYHKWAGLPMRVAEAGTDGGGLGAAGGDGAGDGDRE